MAATDSVLSVLGTSKLFRGLPDDDLAALAGIGLRVRLGKGESLFGEGAPSRGFFLVLKGQVKLYKLSPAGKEQILHVHGPGATFAEATLEEGATYPAYASATEAGEVLLLPRDDLQKLLGRRPQLATNLIARLSTRLRQMTALVEDLSLREAPSRLARYLLELAADDPSPGRIVVLPMKKGALASLLGTRGETLSRIFRRLFESDVIQVQGSEVKILDPRLLRDLAEGEMPGF